MSQLVFGAVFSRCESNFLVMFVYLYCLYFPHYFYSSEDIFLRSSREIIA